MRQAKKIGSLLFALAVVAIFVSLASPPANAVICLNDCRIVCTCSSSCYEECELAPAGCSDTTCGAYGVCSGSSSCTPSCIEGGSGNDTLNGTSGNDCINGKAGADTIYGNSGNDTCHGNDGNDTIYGGSGDDWLYGDADNDYLDGTSGAADYLDGGSGTDTCVNGDTNVSCP